MGEQNKTEERKMVFTNLLPKYMNVVGSERQEKVSKAK